MSNLPDDVTPAHIERDADNGAEEPSQFDALHDELKAHGLAPGYYDRILAVLDAAAIVAEELHRAELARDKWRSAAELAERNYRFMADRADEKNPLEGYRELASQVATALDERDDALAKCRIAREEAARLLEQRDEARHYAAALASGNDDDEMRSGIAGWPR